MINETLSYYGKSQEEIKDPEGILEKIYILCRTHCRLCRMVEDLNAAYGMHLLAISTMTVINVFIEIYFFYVLVKNLKIESSLTQCAYCFFSFADDELGSLDALKTCSDAVGI